MKYIRKLFSSKGEYNFIGWFVVGSCIIVIVTCAYPYVLKRIVGLPCAGEMGQYGDVYGGLNTLFTGLAFVGLGVTIWLQIKERKGQNIQSCKEDIYKRITIIKALEEQVRYNAVKTVIVKEQGEIELKDAAAGAFSGPQAIGEINLAIQYIFNEIENAAADPIKKHTVEGKKLTAFDSMVYITPWLNTLADLLCDIIDYFHEEPEEIRRYIRLVINSSSIHAISLLVLFCDYIARPEVVASLIQKGYIDWETCMVDFAKDPTIRKIVLSYFYVNITFEQALERIVAHKTSIAPHDAVPSTVCSR